MPMSAYEPDLDVGLWDHIFYGYPLSHSCNETYLSNNANFYGENYLRNEFDPCLDVENDEVIAHTLQEELSQSAGAGYSESSCASEDNMLASVLTQDWLCSSRTNSSSGNDYSDEVDGINPCCSCSSPKEKHYDREEQPGTLEFADDVSLIEGEMGRRLSNMASVPHVPKVNGEIPSQDEAMSDHQRLLDRLLMYDLVELKVQGDGNCQFRALSDQIYRISEHHKFVRQQVINQLKYHPEIYEGYVPMAYDVYIKKMSKSGEWGDHVTLQAAADWYGVKIFVMTSFKDTCYVEILPYVQKSKRVIFLSFWAEVHYNSIYPEGELPTKETKKRRWWCRTFGYRH